MKLESLIQNNISLLLLLKSVSLSYFFVKFFRVFCNCFFSVSLDFLLLKEQVNMKGGKRERSLDACSSAFIAFLKIIMRSFCSNPFETTFLTYKHDIDYSRDFLRTINNHYIEYCNKKNWKMNIKSFLLVLK